jgi:hypothetical protein
LGRKILNRQAAVSHHKTSFRVLPETLIIRTLAPQGTGDRLQEALGAGKYGRVG